MRGMKVSVLTVSAALAGSLFAATPGLATDIIAVQFFRGNFQVDTINATTGVQTALGDSGVDRLNSLAATPSGDLYSIGGPNTADQSHLVRINPTTGVGTDLGTLSFDTVPSPSDTAYSFLGLAADASGM